MTRTRFRWVIAAAAAVLAAAAAVGLHRPLPPHAGSAGPAPAAELERIHAACVDAMVRSTCQVMTGSPPSSAAGVVFVAGVGPVDAKAYRELRDSGEAMCGVVRKACLDDWDGAQCRTARGLYGAAGAR